MIVQSELRKAKHYIKMRFILPRNVEIDSPIESSMAPRKCAIIVMTIVVCGIVIVSLLASTKMEIVVLLNGATISYNPRHLVVNSTSDAHFSRFVSTKSPL